MYKTYKDQDGKYHIQRPGTNKHEYHGNGAGAWDGTTETINGHTIEYRSVRYSYRWHKCKVFFDGRQIMSSKGYALAEKAINGE